MSRSEQVQLFLFELFAESNKPAPPTGPKQWSHKLTPRQRQLLEGLPVAAPTRESVMTAVRATDLVPAVRADLSGCDG